MLQPSCSSPSSHPARNKDANDQPAEAADRKTCRGCFSVGRGKPGQREAAGGGGALKWEGRKPGERECTGSWLRDILQGLESPRRHAPQRPRPMLLPSTGWGSNGELGRDPPGWARTERISHGPCDPEGWRAQPRHFMSRVLPTYDTPLPQRPGRSHGPASPGRSQFVPIIPQGTLSLLSLLLTEYEKPSPCNARFYL